MECFKLIVIAFLLYMIFGKKEGYLSKGAYTASAVDRNPTRRTFTSIDDTNANPIVVECGPDKTGCRYIDAPRKFVRWSSQI